MNETYTTVTADHETALSMLWRRLLQFGFRLLYHELAWTYDAVSWLVSFGEWRDWQRAALPLVHGQRVLELGHGPGHILLALQWAGFEVTGLDLSPQMGRIAQRRAPSVSLLRGEGAALPLATAVYDTVLATFPTEYIVAPETIREVYRVLGANGRFIVVPQAHFTRVGPLASVMEWLYRITGQREPIIVPDVAQSDWPRHPVWRQVRQRFIETGFNLSVQQIHLSHSAVTVIIADKTLPLGLEITDYPMIQ